MPNIPLVQAGERARVGAPEVTATGTQFGAGIGEAIQGIGGELMDWAGTIATVRRQKAALDAAAASASLDFTPEYIEQLKNAPPDGSGFADGTMEAYDNWSSQQLDLIEDPNVRERVKRDLDADRARISSNAYKEEYRLLEQNAGEQVKAGVGATLNTIRTSPENYNVAVGKGLQVLEETPGLTPAAKQAAKRAYESNAARARFEGMLDAATTPEQVEQIGKELDADLWREKMTPQEYEQVVDRHNTAQNTVNGAVKAEMTARLNSFRERDGKPDALIPESELLPMRQMVEQYGTPEDVRDYWKIVKSQSVMAAQRGQPYTQVLRNEADARAGVTVKGWQNYETQLAFGQWELENTHKSAGAALKATGDLSSATYTFMAQYERPAAWAMKKSFPKRLQYAQQVLAGGGGKAAQQAFAFYKSKGWAPIHAAAIVGNFMGESNLRTGAHGDKTIPGGSRGIGQWNRERLVRLQQFAGDYSPTGAFPDMSEAQAVTLEATTKVREGMEKAFGPNGDMMTYAQSSGHPGITVGPLDSMDAFRLRGQEALQVAEFNSIPTENATPLTQSEVQVFTQRLSTGSADEVTSMFAQLGAMGPDMQAAAMRQIGAKEPVYGYAGAMYNEDTAATSASIVRGYKQIDTQEKRDATFKMIKGNQLIDFDQQFYETAGNATALLNADQISAARTAATAFYIDRYGRQPWNADNYAASVREVLGHQAAVGNVNSEPTVIPRGVTPEQMDEAVNSLTDSDLIKLSPQERPPMYANGDPVTSDDIAYEGKFRAIDDEGHYAIEMSDYTILTTGLRAPNGQMETYVIKLDKSAVDMLVNRYEKVPGFENGPSVLGGGLDGGGFGVPQ
jgi:hypothetical protein